MRTPEGYCVYSCLFVALRHDRLLVVFRQALTIFSLRCLGSNSNNTFNWEIHRLFILFIMAEMHQNSNFAFID